ncbi:porin [Chryseobacterium sp. PTM-20240506]|uniref:porin n=1 Tax=unclassified Chryseobacterium TaxID=2593645 RepID=UPI002358C2FE|nr:MULTISPECIES: porin [unclassified Chryseobacterium]MDC8105430.1 porin [Chryseobacterium sp. B21-037]MDQ1805685.1 porin [Chryseobacterium sp. CKR4-1]
MKKLFIIFGLAALQLLYSQDTAKVSTNPEEVISEKNPLDIGELKINLNPKGDKWLKFGISSQIWLRSIDNNPGTLVNGVPQQQTYDAGIRRMRLTIQSQLTPFYSVFLQMGINNQSFISGGGSGTGNNGAGKKAPFFFHDAYNELAIIPRNDFQTGKPNKNNLYLGAGLHSWNGVSRLTNASTTKMLAGDIPVFNFPAIEIADQFSRQFGIFVHGEFDRLNYRFSVNKPFATNLKPVVGGPAVDNNQSGKLSYSGYAFYQFFNKETTVTSFLPGNNLAARKVLNIGTGFYSTKDATQSQPSENVFESHAANVFGADIYSELPLGNKSKEMGLTLYSVFYNYNYGPNYLRVSGLLNPGTPDPQFTGQKALEGAGNNRILMGTGNIWFSQVGFVLPKFSKILKVQPFFNYALKDMKALNQNGSYYDVGANFYLYGQNARIVVQYSSRPLYDLVSKTIFDRKGEFLLSLQIIL